MARANFMLALRQAASSRGSVLFQKSTVSCRTLSSGVATQRLEHEQQGKREGQTGGLTLSSALDAFPIGRNVCGYEVKDVLHVPELSMAAIRLSHSKTGAEHLHLARPHENNVFSVGFKTVPMDRYASQHPPPHASHLVDAAGSTGVPHILEHIALCGSQRFAVRDPFFKMLTRSQC